MPVKNLLIKNNEYSGVRAVIQASQSGVTNYYYTEAKGDRYYYTVTGATAAPQLETVTFDAYLSFTMSGSVTYDFNIIPMSTGETCFLDVSCTAVNSDCSKGLVMKTFGGFRHTGSSLAKIQNQINYTKHSDFSSSVDMTISAYGTQSVKMTLTGVAGEVIDWDIYLRYTKGYHTLTTGGGSGGGTPWYPTPPNA